ncbi:MAG: hypothetical protein ABII01_06945 [Candidatus Woesearchaeota archaeon]
MKNVIIIGTGEIGSALIELLDESGKYKVFKKDIEPVHIDEPIDIMHICIPFFDNFNDIVINYINEYKPKLVIINSTVRPGTTRSIFKKTNIHLVHSPVRGRHPKLLEGLKKFVKFIGPVTPEAGEMAKEHFESLGLKTEVFGSSVDSELGKLFETTYYAINIAFHQEMDRICQEFGADFKYAVTRFSATQTMDIEHKVPRPLMFPGIIGGHCLLPNIEILKKDISSDFLNAIISSNELTKKRVEQGKVKYKDIKDLIG